MEAADEMLGRLLDKVRGYAESVDADIADRENDFRSMCFWNMYNRIVMTREILGFYGGAWDSIDAWPHLEGELTERVVTVTRDMFVDTVSSIEKASKDCVDAYKSSGLREKSMEGRSYLYLRNIIAASADLGYINDAVLEDWDDILVMRNLVAHNNSVADRSKMFEVGGIRISMRPNRMMKGPRATFIVLTERAVDLFHDWLCTIDVMFG